jgi:hypothetical protein
VSEADHFFKCEMCGGFYDMRDLAQVLDHEGMRHGVTRKVIRCSKHFLRVRAFSTVAPCIIEIAAPDVRATI